MGRKGAIIRFPNGSNHRDRRNIQPSLSMEIKARPTTGEENPTWV